VLTVACWLWGEAFEASHVNRLGAMVRRFYSLPFRFVCVTNRPSGIDKWIDIIRDTEDFEDVMNPHGAGYPSCYRRLRAFRPSAEAVFGKRFVSLDLDAVILRDLVPLWNSERDFVGLRDSLHRTQFNGSMFMLRAGKRPQVWTEFDPKSSPREARFAGYKGSDQAWISYVLGDGESTWTQDDGVYNFKFDLASGGPPANARIVFFTGRPKPWDDECQRMPWIRDNYR
jgi:hypothetical protein